MWTLLQTYVNYSHKHKTITTNISELYPNHMRILPYKHLKNELQADENFKHMTTWPRTIRIYSNMWELHSKLWELYIDDIRTLYLNKNLNKIIMNPITVEYELLIAVVFTAQIDEDLYEVELMWGGGSLED